MRRGSLLKAMTAAAVLAALAGCSRLDVVGSTAVSTFDALVKAQPASVAKDAQSARWVLTSPGGERFEWSSDFAAEGPSFRVTLDATPFLVAGLDPARLPSDPYSYDAASKTLALSFQVGREAFSYRGEPSALDTFKEIVRTHRPIIGYHAALDHYGISLGGGNMFEWAKTMTTNDKDMVFVLDPKLLREAGVDPARVTGWVFAKIPVKDSKGQTVEVDKFVKPYNVK